VLTPLTPEAKQTTRIGLAYIVHPRCIVMKDGTALRRMLSHDGAANEEASESP
jgi:hypothetical protein